LSRTLERTRFAAGGCDPRLVQAGPAEDREAVVFVHGNPGSADDWAPLVGAVAAATGRRALAFDLPDFGRTYAPPGFEHSTDGYAGFVDAALEALGVERAHLVLHDFGGPIGLTWAVERLDRVASLTLIDTGLLPGYEWHALARVWRTPVLGEAFQAISTPGALRRGLAGKEPRGLPADFLETVSGHYDRATRRAVLKLYRATPDPGRMSEEMLPRFAGREIPALVIWGEHDAYLPAEYAWRQREAFPAARVAVLPASGHWPYADAPETVERLLVDFLTGLGPGASG
jgi:pimeloyl-ACP methyl ester carboxylesterase